jgi:sporulation protein YlmC with PRC-barrel domain
MGKISNVVVDRNAWRVTQLEVKLDDDVAKEYGVKRALRSTVVPLKTDEVKTVGDAVLLKEPKLTPRVQSGRTKDETKSKKVK